MSDQDVREVVDDHETRLAAVELEQVGTGKTVARIEGKVDALLHIHDVNPKKLVKENPGEMRNGDELKLTLRGATVVRILKGLMVVLLAAMGAGGISQLLGV